MDHVPRWNGDPAAFKRWQQEVRIYKLRKDLSKEVSFAAELVTGLSGPARAAALQLTEADLWPYDSLLADAVQHAADQSHDDHVEPVVPPTMREVNLKAIDLLVQRLEQDLLQSKPVQRGERMESFFATNKFHRRPGMRMTEYNLLWHRGVEELAEVGIDLLQLGDVAGWFYLRGARLSEEQRERVLSTLPDEHFPVDRLKATLVRFFPALHLREARRPPQPPPRSTSSRFSGRSSAASSSYSRARGVHVAEHEEAQEDQESEEEEGEEDESQSGEVLLTDLQGALRGELNDLVNEMEAAGDGDLPEELAGKLETACATLSDASEALQTVREARETFRKNQGPGGKPRPKPKPKKKGKAAPKKMGDKIKARKANSTCHVCGKKGHWSGDPECPGEPHGTNVTESAAEPAQEEEVPIRDVWVTGAGENFDSGRAVIDTACKFSVAGNAWYADYKAILESHGLGDEIEETPELERYRFGNGGVLESRLRACVPVVLCGRPLRVCFSIVESSRLTLLLGRDILEELQANLDMRRGLLRIGSGTSQLVDSKAGHFAVELRPESWRPLAASTELFDARLDLPRRLQPSVRSRPPRTQQAEPSSRPRAVTETTRSSGRTLLQRCLACIAPALLVCSGAQAPCAGASTLPCSAGAAELPCPAGTAEPPRPTDAHDVMVASSVLPCSHCTVPVIVGGSPRVRGECSSHRQALHHL